MDFGRVRTQIHDVTPKRIERNVFARAHSTLSFTAWANKYLFNSVHSYERGFRYNYKMTWPVYYLACDRLTASAEIGPREVSDFFGGLRTASDPPVVYFDVFVSAEVLDLTDSSVLTHLGISFPELMISTKEWEDKMAVDVWSDTHRIGAIALAEGRFDGILYPSYAVKNLIDVEGKQNIALFMDKDSEEMSKPKRSSVEIEVVDTNNYFKNQGLIY